MRKSYNLSLLANLFLRGCPRSVASFGVRDGTRQTVSRRARERVTFRIDVASVTTIASNTNRSMCGLVNKKMNTQEVVEELTQVCIQMRFHLDDLEQREKEILILKHIRRFENSGAARDFPKGLEWFNVSEGLSLGQHLKGKIVLLDFFTYCCINCMHVLAELEEVEKKISVEDGLVVIGVHSAKFTNERSSKNVLSAVQRYNITHPVVNDVTLRMWHDMGITCWPSLIMLGPNGQPLAVFVGENHKDEILLYTKIAISYFKSLKQMSNHGLPLKPAHHLLPSSKDGLLFPGKLTVLQLEQQTKLVISDSGNNRIVITNEHGRVEHVIGGCNQGFKDGDFKNARFNSPQGVCVLNNVIYVADNNNHAIRKINLAKKIVSTIAGTGSQGCDRKGGKHGTDQALSSPWDVAIYHHEYKGITVPVLLIAIAGTHQIWALFLEDTIWWKEKKYTAGTCAAIVGSGREENRNNSYPHAAGLAQPSGIAIVQECKVAFFADSESSAIRRLHLDSGQVSAVCGGDKNPANLHAFGDVDGKGHLAKLQHPLGVTWNHLDKRIYVADTYNHKIKSVDPTTEYCKTLFGDKKPDHTFIFNEPSGLAVSPDGNILYVADTNNHALKIIDLKNEKISTMAVVSRRDSNRNTDNVFTFDTTVNARSGELNISFNIVFTNDLKLNADAPQEWQVSLPANTWTAKSLTGRLSTPISVKLPEEETRNQLSVTLNIMACTVDTCVPLKLSVLFNVQRKTDAPTVVTEEKELVIG
ncbi:PREDICTED: NHL repeat-containing protein 2 isoform X2 [Trachymyrmex septentrionalis]|uniref:NHL repeat-containing protein 2 isoform X2 n=1 Tax=Trachymyrmex septentrionalis TaxID=34720 RepID=UPI00084F4C94|nr:PREDICTED: NHL repeat-containing protein 2 isoform X2 [Trachymyrmex septentrionalis]